MTMFSTRGRKALAILAACATLIVAGEASAKPIFIPKPFPHGPHFPHFPHGPHFGWGAAALAGTLAAGAIVAGEALAEDCVVTHRVYIDEDGTEVVRRVRLCD